MGFAGCLIWISKVLVGCMSCSATAPFPGVFGRYLYYAHTPASALAKVSTIMPLSWGNGPKFGVKPRAEALWGVSIQGTVAGQSDFCE